MLRYLTEKCCYVLPHSPAFSATSAFDRFWLFGRTWNVRAGPTTLQTEVNSHAPKTSTHYRNTWGQGASEMSLIHAIHFLPLHGSPPHWGPQVRLPPHHSFGSGFKTFKGSWLGGLCWVISNERVWNINKPHIQICFTLMFCSGQNFY